MAIDLFSPGAYCRSAGGNLERPDLQRPVCDWMAWSINPDNGGNGSPDVWAPARKRWKAAGMVDFPWMHVRSMADLTRLVSVGKNTASPAIGVNIEDVVSDHLSLQEIGQYLTANWNQPVHMATLCWVQNGQGWQHMAFAVAALEIFVDEVPACKDIQGCIDHAQAEGLPNVTLMLKTKPPNTKATYGDFWNVCHSLYTADDITPTVEEWLKWKAPTPCEKVTVRPMKPLTEKQFPYTGPFREGDKDHPTIQGLKRGQVRLGNLRQDLSSVTDDFGPELALALRKFQKKVGIVPTTGNYGRATWLALRSAIVPAEMPHQGEYAMDALALKLVRQDALTMVYPHPKGSLSQIGQGLHITDGLAGNWAIDFMAPGGTKVLAVERSIIRKLSGRPPSSGWYGPGIFGYSIHYETAAGYRYFSTHYGSRSSLAVGQVVELGQVLGTVGLWPGDPGRSHTHLGVTSPLGTADAKKRITAVSVAPKIEA